MKKRFRIFLILAFGLVSIAWVSGWHDHFIPTVTDTYDVGSSERSVRAIYIGPNKSYIDEAAQEINLPIGAFTSDGILLLGNSTPLIASQNKVTAITWAVSISDKAQQTFRVPDNYHSGGRFTCIVDLTASATDIDVDFDVLVNTAGTVWDITTTDQTAVAVKHVSTASVGTGSPAEITLDVTTDFASLAAGQLVTIRLWRNTTGVTASSASLEMSSVRFEYNY